MNATFGGAAPAGPREGEARPPAGAPLAGSGRRADHPGVMARASAGVDPEKAGELKAVQAALAAEHAAVYGYGVVGGKIGKDRGGEARAAWDAHRSRRDDLARAARDLGAVPRAAAAGYDLPFAVDSAADAERLAAELEERVAGAYADLVRSSTGTRRRAAADAVREAAVRAVRWRGGGVTFPGLTERASETPAPAGPSGPTAPLTPKG